MSLSQTFLNAACGLYLTGVTVLAGGGAVALACLTPAALAAGGPFAAAAAGAGTLILAGGALAAGTGAYNVFKDIYNEYVY